MRASDAVLRTIATGLRHQLAGAPRPAQRQPSWRQRLSRRPLAQTTQNCYPYPPFAGRLAHSDELGRLFRPAQERSVTLPPPARTHQSKLRSATPLTPAAAPPSPPVVVSARLAHGTCFGADQIPIDHRSREACELRSRNKSRSLPFTHRPALTLASMQQPDGTWGHAMLTVPVVSRRALRRRRNHQRRSTTARVRLGQRHAAAHARATRALSTSRRRRRSRLPVRVRRAKGTIDEDMARRARAILREAAAADARAGRLRGRSATARRRAPHHRARRRRIFALRSRRSRSCASAISTCSPAEAAPPSIHCLFMLAYMPLFRNEHHDAMALLYHHLAQPLPRQEAMQLVRQEVRGAAAPRPRRSCSPNRNAADADVVLADHVARAHGAARLPPPERQLVQALRALPRRPRRAKACGIRTKE